ncbi:hypothetical protein NZD89_14325 [Alicyclobacillus fastidiosus]|uniref:DUF91 domain-containing protein n=1 Tax=Alicyclobacillus fastidiosus TaxID=392011 RepID=A0ABY6ZBL3_9BACL|nr:hypothetical protein [Alicyclobacillus fastidiosus]WAH39599.1 hypothetical protein NZD89_14325 [Alicyclobacillus fastidiosus]
MITLSQDVVDSVYLAFRTLGKTDLSRNELFEFILEKLPQIQRHELGTLIVAITVNNPRRESYVSSLKVASNINSTDILYKSGGDNVKTFTYRLWNSHDLCVSKPQRNNQNDSLSLLVDEFQWDHHKRSSKLSFPSESHLRDFVVRNIPEFKIRGKTLHTYIHTSGRTGVEFATEVGRIDYLAIDDDGCFYVFEFKLHKGVDAVVGQVCRYIGWVQQHLARESSVYGIIVVSQADVKLRYASSIFEKITLLEYDISCFLNICRDSG